MIKQRVNRVYHVGILYFYMYIKDKENDKMISIRKRGNVYQYCFEATNIECNMLYGDYLDFWYDNYCKVNLKYTTQEAYKDIIEKY